MPFAKRFAQINAGFQWFCLSLLGQLRTKSEVSQEIKCKTRTFRCPSFFDTIKKNTNNSKIICAAGPLSLMHNVHFTRGQNAINAVLGRAVEMELQNLVNSVGECQLTKVTTDLQSMAIVHN